MLQLNEHLQKLHAEQISYVLVTLVDIQGSAPQVVGAKMLVTSGGLFWGTVGGGKIEAHSIRHAQELLLAASKETATDKSFSELKKWNLQTQIGMSCGGEVSLFFDVQFLKSWPIYIFGAGHISQELCRLLSTWSCQVQVFDPRPEWLERLPSRIKAVRSENPPSEINSLAENGFVLCMTQGHATDLPILSAALIKNQNNPAEKRFPFVGVIGSSTKARKIKLELKQLGIQDSEIERIQCPLGLPIGNNTPAEIAVSIAAQLLAVRDRCSFKVQNGLAFTGNKL